MMAMTIAGMTTAAGTVTGPVKMCIPVPATADITDAMAEMAAGERFDGEERGSSPAPEA